jgi:hypothetical protein
MKPGMTMEKSRETAGRVARGRNGVRCWRFRHPEVAARSAALEGWRSPFEARAQNARSLLRVTGKLTRQD